VLFTVEHPLGRPDCSAEFTSNQGLVDFAGAVEDLGFDAIAFTEHPAPSRKWLDSGGHCSVDPLVALGFCAALTTRIRLLTYLLVLPYRNPLLAAKSIATVDVLSNGRLVVGAGSGYLRSEFAALGVDFEQRTQLLDEAIEVLREVWTGESYAHDGLHFSARGQVSLPPPVQLPHPPIWIGGNSRSGRRRVARVAQGWTPLLLDERIATATRTPPLRTPAELATAIKELHQLVAAEGRDPADIEIQVQTPQSAFLTTDTISMEQHRDHLGQLADAGVTSFVVQVAADTVEHVREGLHRYAEDFDACSEQEGLLLSDHSRRTDMLR
jgi:probable F420-dependent oxidoreductase